MNGHGRDCAQGPMLEALEQRMLLSAELLNNGTLNVFGTRQDDTVIIQDAGDPGELRLFGVPGVSDGTVFEGVRRLRVRLKAGADTARIDGIPRDSEGEVMFVILFGGAGPDELELVTTDGRLVGNRGNDTLFGGPGENKLVGGPGGDFLAGGGGDDKLIGNQGNDRLFAEAGDDLLRGGRGNDLLRGGSGNDTLFGGKNNDDLYGGSGFDQVNGSSGSDVFRGTFFEWDDFNDEDRYFDELYDINPRDVTLPDSFWAEMNAIDSEYAFLIPDDAWRVVDALQHVYASAPAERMAFEAELAELSDPQREALGELALDELRDFLAGFDEPEDIDSGDLSGLFADISDLMAGDLRTSYDALVDAIQGDQDLLESVVLGVQELSTGEFPPEFENLVSDLLFGV